MYNPYIHVDSERNSQKKAVPRSFLRERPGKSLFFELTRITRDFMSFLVSIESPDL